MDDSVLADAAVHHSYDSRSLENCKVTARTSRASGADTLGHGLAASQSGCMINAWQPRSAVGRYLRQAGSSAC
jgi:hypothetical protein